MKLVHEVTEKTYQIPMREALDFPFIEAAVDAALNTMDGWTLVNHMVDYDKLAVQFTVRKSKGL
jgi:hypothetical protein